VGPLDWRTDVAFGAPRAAFGSRTHDALAGKMRAQMALMNVVHKALLAR
jgi:hypothetical protein